MPLQTSELADLVPANRVELDQRVLATSKEYRAAAKAYQAALVAHGPDAPLVQTLQAVRNAALATYTHARSEWRTAWQPWRDAQRRKRAETRRRLHAAQSETRAAQLRASACSDCGLVHRGTC